MFFVNIDMLSMVENEVIPRRLGKLHSETENHRKRLMSTCRVFMKVIQINICFFDGRILNLNIDQTDDSVKILCTFFLK